MDEDSLSLEDIPTPPTSLKELYKRYKKLKLEDSAADPNILDPNTDHLADDLEALEPLKILHLESIFRSFVGDDGNELSIKQDAPIYSHRRLPGLLILPSLLPLNVQKSLISRLLHQELSDLMHKTNLHLHYEIPYPGNPGAESQASDAAPDTFRNITSFFSYSPLSNIAFIPKDTSVHRPLSIAKVLQKSLRWITLGGQYDWTNKVYPDEKPPAFPKDISGLLTGLFPAMKPQAAIINLYSPGDTLNLHRDISENSDRGLISISLGCDCLFVIGNQHTSDGIVIRLRSGDAVFMDGDARFAWHGVPRILPNTCPTELKSWPAESGRYEEWRGWMGNKRINFNVRQMND